MTMQPRVTIAMPAYNEEKYIETCIASVQAQDYPADLIEILETKVGRLIFNGFSTGVEVCPSMVHGGPYPATSDGRSTAVGTHAIERFSRLVCFQNFPEASLPDELKEQNPLRIMRLVDGEMS